MTAWRASARARPPIGEGLRGPRRSLRRGGGGNDDVPVVGDDIERRAALVEAAADSSRRLLAERLELQRADVDLAVADGRSEVRIDGWRQRQFQAAVGHSDVHE